MSAVQRDMPVRAIAPAKINPWLEVVGRRPDGYHEIRTWMLAVDLCDRLEVEAIRADEIVLDVSGPCASADVPRDASNLCWRAAAAAIAHARRTEVDLRARGVRLRLEKNIPSQAGLGGASADAAATWVATLAALGAEATAEESDVALAALGSDCVFFGKAASTGLAWCEGRGERVTIAARPSSRWFVALLTPDVRCPTAAVYAAFRKPLRDSRPPNRLPPAWSEMPVETVRRLFFNALEAVALDAIPALVPWRSTLDAGGGELFRLSGSGSSFYGLFDNLDEARSTLDRVVAEARVRGLHARGHWIVRAAGFGATLESAASSNAAPTPPRESKNL
jgi:4-diphosphocytidyl-2-C-methyl-D-erythritol kinase